MGEREVSLTGEKRDKTGRADGGKERRRAEKLIVSLILLFTRSWGPFSAAPLRSILPFAPPTIIVSIYLRNLKSTRSRTTPSLVSDPIINYSFTMADAQKRMQALSEEFQKLQTGMSPPPCCSPHHQAHFVSGL